MILVEDLPNIETLHADLDQAVSCHPKRAFLRRFRASPAQIRVQKAEQSFAHAVAIRGWFAAHQRSELTGAGPIQFAWNLPQKTGSTSAPRAEGPFHVVLAGGASARNGVMEALAILEARKDLILWVRPTDGLMPSSLIQHPRIRHFRNQTELPKDIDCLLAPAWVESYPPELHMAIQRGIPVVGSLRAVGFLSDSPAAHIVPPGEIEKIGAALKRALKSQPDTKAKLPSFGCLPPDLREWSASLNLG